MLTWSNRKKILHVTILSVIVLVVVLITFFVFVYKKPNCSDGIKNQDEIGVDCGGQCMLLCGTEVSEPVIYWQRAFQIRPGFYNLVAYFENKNDSASSPSAPYYFKVYDSDNLLIAERFGNTFIEANKVAAVFEGGVSTGGRTPARVVFGFDPGVIWQKAGAASPGIAVYSSFMDRSGGFPNLSVTLENSSRQAVKNFPVVVILYDEQGNAKTASKTEVDFLGPESNEKIYFTWPEEFDFTIGRIEILSKTYPGLNY